MFVDRGLFLSQFTGADLFEAIGEVGGHVALQTAEEEGTDAACEARHGGGIAFPCDRLFVSLPEVIGIAEIRQVFRISKIGAIAGCMVTNGFIRRNARLRLLRDNVVVFTGDSPAPLLTEIRPDVHCKGTDYGTPERVPEFAIVAAYGGRTALVGDPKDHATSDIIQKVRALPSVDAKTAVY